MRTLVLNAGYEPLAIVPFRRAITLVLSGKAVILVADETPVRSAERTVPRPAVVVLTRYVRIPYQRRVPLSRRGVLRRDGHRCCYCGRAASTVDHVLPRSRGGQDTWENLVAACLPCNGRKGDSTPAEIGWTLAQPPRAPRGGSWVVRGSEHRSPAWEGYLPAVVVAA